MVVLALTPYQFALRNHAVLRVPVIDGATNTVTTTIGGLPESPQGIDVNPITNRIYVVDVRGETLVVINGATNTVMATIPGLFFRSRMVGVNPMTNKIYVGNGRNGFGTTV